MKRHHSTHHSAHVAPAPSSTSWQATLLVFVALFICAFLLLPTVRGDDTATAPDQVAADPKAQVLVMLNRLSSLSITRSLFDSPVFNSLNDTGIEVIPEVKGRPNPFAPIGQ